MLANAVMASATTMTAAPRPANIGRVDGRRMGRLKPEARLRSRRGLNALNAVATSSLSSGAESKVAAARASSAMPLLRAWHAAQSV